MGMRGKADLELSSEVQLWHNVREELSFGGGHKMSAGDVIKWVPASHNSCDGCCDDADHGGTLQPTGPDGWGANVVMVRLSAAREDIFHGCDGHCVYMLCLKQGAEPFKLQSHVTAVVNFEPPSPPPPPPSPPPPSPPPLPPPPRPRRHRRRSRHRRA